jgi:hypothetical protein
MTDDATPPGRRAARFADRLRSDPLGRPAGGVTLAWVASRLVLIAVILLVAWFAFWMVVRTCACTPLPNFPPSPVEGIVVSVDSAGLGQVRGFDLRSDAGTTHFQMGTLENPTDFPPGHLAEHQATSSPVRVYFRVEGGGTVALVYRLEDAILPPSS